MTSSTSTYRELDQVVLTTDVPEAGLRAGDVGTVVLVYGGEATEVEFVLYAGRTLAPQMFVASEMRSLADDYLPAVRPVGSVSGAT